MLSALGVNVSEGCPARALAVDVDLHLESLRWRLPPMGTEKLGDVTKHYTYGVYHFTRRWRKQIVSW